MAGEEKLKPRYQCIVNSIWEETASRRTLWWFLKFQTWGKSKLRKTASLPLQHSRNSKDTGAPSVLCKGRASTGRHEGQDSIALQENPLPRPLAVSVASSSTGRAPVLLNEQRANRCIRSNTSIAVTVEARINKEWAAVLLANMLHWVSLLRELRSRAQISKGGMLLP